MLTTCTFASTGLTIGWSNAANYSEFRDWISYRMASGFTFLIADKPPSHQPVVVFNNATKINSGVSQTQVHAIMREMEHDYLTSGDISIVRMEVNTSDFRSMAETPQQVLNTHTIEIPPQIKQ